MAQSLSKIYIHLIFHIKSTSPQIRENDLERLLPLQGAWLLAVYPGRCPGLGASAPSGRVGQILLLPFTFPLGVPPDLESGIKKCPNLFRFCGFAIRSKGVCFPFCWGITNPPVLIGRTFFYGGFQIRRDA